jgi:hypothetical protein
LALIAPADGPHEAEVSYIDKGADDEHLQMHEHHGKATQQDT